MDANEPMPLLGGLSPKTFMRRHWQRAPLLVRQGFDARPPLITRSRLFALAAREEVESRLVQRLGPKAWRLAHGPLARSALPPISQTQWTLLVQGVDLHLAAAREVLASFSFLQRARLDDLMVSYATDGGGVGPHVDSYDVFLMQIHGRRRWRISPPGKQDLQPGVPLRILKRFTPTQEWLLEPGDLLYLPPDWAHDGVAEGECMTASVGFRAPRPRDLAGDLLQRLADQQADEEAGELYTDAGMLPTAAAGRVPAALQAFARQAVRQALRQPRWLQRALGEALTEPKPRVVFKLGRVARLEEGVRPAGGTRILYDEDHVFINGESYDVNGRDAVLLQHLADRRVLTPGQVRKLSVGARQCLEDWLADGWLEADREP